MNGKQKRATKCPARGAHSGHFVAYYVSRNVFCVCAVKRFF
jgi:hypothetical protein